MFLCTGGVSLSHFFGYFLLQCLKTILFSGYLVCLGCVSMEPLSVVRAGHAPFYFEFLFLIVYYFILSLFCLHFSCEFI